MARYIRTKDGVYEWDCPIENLLGSEIIARADTIEELCDEFVYVSKQNEDYEKNEKPIIAITRKLTSLIKIANATNSVVLGAIWTSKGLIYVAKMNENGELELI